MRRRDSYALVLLPSVILFTSYLLIKQLRTFSKKPETHATGYLADRGVVRIWQHTTPSGFIALDSLFTPFDGTDEVETTYLWDQQQLIHIDKNRWARMKTV